MFFLLLLFLIIFNNFFTIPIQIENVRLKLALTIPTGAPITVPNDAIKMRPIVIDKTTNELLNQSKEAMCLLSLLLISSLSSIAAKK